MPCPCRWLIQDTLKVLTYKLLYAFDIFQIKSGSFMGKAGHAPGTEHLLGIQVCTMMWCSSCEQGFSTLQSTQCRRHDTSDNSSEDH